MAKVKNAHADKSGRVLACVRVAGVAALLACTAAIIAAVPPPPETEELVEGVRFLEQADTLDTLRDMAEPEFAWTDDDGVTIFLWARKGPKPDTWHFTVDSPHFVRRQGGKPFWCLFDTRSETPLPFGHPVSQFHVLKFVREELPFPGDYGHDGNNSEVRLLAERAGGERVFELVYCSMGGGRAHQEQMKTYLLYISPEGQVMRASEDLGHQGSFPHGAHGANDSLEQKVVWEKAGDSPPFTVSLRRSETEWVRLYDGRSADDEWFEYTSWQDGALSGAFPMRAQWQRARYLEIKDDRTTLARIAEALRECYSGWSDYDWVPAAERPRVKQEITARWLRGLSQLNPGVGPQEVLAKGRRLVAFEDAYGFGRGIFDVVRATLPDRAPPPKNEAPRP